MHVRPERHGLGSGGFVGAEGAPVQELPRFPTMPQLVLDEENTNLLAALLPALNKYGCLESPIWRTKNRSPWVRAYCDLYHPSGLWGSNKFRNVPAMENKNARYSFKSYRIQKVYETLENSYKGDSAVHKDLYKKLREYKEKEKYYNDYMDACKEIVRNEISKPTEKRVPIPTTTASVAAAATATVNNNTAAAAATASSASQAQSSDDTRQANVVVIDEQAPPSQLQTTASDKNQHEDTSSEKPKEDEELKTIWEVLASSGSSTPPEESNRAETTLQDDDDESGEDTMKVGVGSRSRFSTMRSIRARLKTRSMSPKPAVHSEKGEGKNEGSDRNEQNSDDDVLVHANPPFLKRSLSPEKPGSQRIRLIHELRSKPKKRDAHDDEGFLMQTNSLGLKDQEVKDELLQVGDKVYAPYPGDDPVSEYYYWGKVSKKYKDGGDDGGNVVWKYDIDFFDGDQGFGLTSQDFHRMKATFDLMRKGHLSNDPPPEEYMEEDKEEEKNRPTVKAKNNPDAKSSIVAGSIVLPIAKDMSKDDQKKKRKSHHARKLPEIEASENEGKEKEQEQEAAATSRTPPSKRQRVIEAGGPDYIADSPSRINQKGTNNTAVVTPVAASLPPPPPPPPPPSESMQSNEDSSSTSVVVSSTGKVATATAATATLASTSSSREEKIEKSRSKLVQLLQRRRQLNANDDDPVCIKIQNEIDRLDTETMDLILLDDAN